MSREAYGEESFTIEEEIPKEDISLSIQEKFKEVAENEGIWTKPCRF